MVGLLGTGTFITNSVDLNPCSSVGADGALEMKIERVLRGDIQ